MELFSDSSDMIFLTIFAKSRTMLRFGFDPETNVFGFYGVFVGNIFKYGLLLIDFLF